MPELTVIVPTRDRPHAVQPLADAFAATCTADTHLLLVIEDDDPQAQAYEQAALDAGASLLRQDGGSMVAALNHAASLVTRVESWAQPAAVGFLGDDHRPRTSGWDRAYLDALRAAPGIVYGDDLLQGPNLPTQCAMSTDIIRALGYMAPPVLTHLYVDNYWLDLGRAANCITYLPHVVVEHVHPAAGKTALDDGYRRVNAPAVDVRDRDAYLAYAAAHLDTDAAKLAELRAGVAR